MTTPEPPSGAGAVDSLVSEIEMFAQLSPDLHASFQRYQSTVLPPRDGAVEAKFAALIALAVAVSMPSDDLADAYAAQAEAAGARDEEIVEAIYAAAALRTGAAVSYGQLAFKFLDHSPDAPEDFHYHERTDGKYALPFRKADSAAFACVQDVMTTLHVPNRALPAKYYELAAMAVAVLTQCVYCLDKHTNDARKQGATDGEIAEAAHIASALRTQATLLDGARVFQRRLAERNARA